MGERIRIIDDFGKKEIENKLDTAEEIREKLKNPEYLPSIAEIKKAFNNLWDREAWKKFCSGIEFEPESEYNEPVHEVLNKEFISALGDYLIGRGKEFGATKEKPALALEVGAGNGRLTHFLEERIKQKKFENINLIATDIGKWWGWPYFWKPKFPIEKLSYNKALKKYNPDIIICSWMPDKDWTADFRQQKTVKEYILTGKTDETGIGYCGDPWRTWGAYSPDEEKEFKGKIPPYEADGFEKIPLDEISKYQICRDDYPYEKGGIVQHSKTVSFRRKSIGEPFC